MFDETCPYCKADVEVNADGEGYEEDVTHHGWCGNCEKSFCYSTRIIYHYKVWQAPCLNEGEHVFKPTTTHPIELTKMECSCCGERREPTAAEMEWILSSSNPYRHANH